MTRLFGEILRFGATGSLGFVVDAGLVTLLCNVWGLGPALARVIAIGAAVMVTITVNRHWTFEHARSGRLWFQSFAYVAVQGAGLALNFAVFMALVAQGGTWQRWPFLAVAAGSIAAMAVTFGLSKWVVFRPVSSHRRGVPG